MREQEGTVLGVLHSSGVKDISSRQRRKGCSAVSTAAEERGGDEARKRQRSMMGFWGPRSVKDPSTDSSSGSCIISRNGREGCRKTGTKGRGRVHFRMRNHALNFKSKIRYG